MGNEMSQGDVSNSEQRDTDLLQPWTALSLYPQPTISKDLPATSNTLGRSPIKDVTKTLQKMHSKQCTSDCENLENVIAKPMFTKENEIVKQAAELSLTAEEMDHLNQVLSRVRQLEQREGARISKLQNELQKTEQEVRRRVSVSQQDVTSGNFVCFLCGRMQQSTKDDEASADKRITWHLCSDCENQVCEKCGSVFGKQTEGESLWLCNLCQKKRRLRVSSGAWLQELQSSSGRTKAIKKMFAKKPIARTSSFTQYEEWLNRIENDTASDKSSAEDQPIKCTREVRRHSDKIAPLKNAFDNPRRVRRRVLSRDQPVEEHLKNIDDQVTAYNLATGEAIVEVDSSGNVPKVQVDLPHNSENKSSVEDAQSFDQDEDTISWNSQHDSEAEKASQEMSPIHITDKTEQNLIKSRTVDFEAEVSKQNEVLTQAQSNEAPEVSIESDNVLRRDNFKPSLQATPCIHDVIIQPETAEVKNLFLRNTQEPNEITSPDRSTESDQVTPSSVCLSRWSNHKDEFSEQSTYQDQYAAYSSRHLASYERFNSTFDEEPLYEDQDKFQPRDPKVSNEENSYDRWFGSQEFSLKAEHAINPSSFFAVTAIRPSPTNQTSSPEQLARFDLGAFSETTQTLENIGDQYKYLLQDTDWDETHSTSDGQHTTTSYLSKSKPHVEIRRGNSTSGLPVSSFGHVDHVYEPYCSRRASEPQTRSIKLRDVNVCDIELEQHNFEYGVCDEYNNEAADREVANARLITDLNRELMNSVYTSGDSINYPSTNQRTLSQKRFSYPLDVVQLSRTISNQLVNLDLSDQDQKSAISNHYYRSIKSKSVSNTSEGTKDNMQIPNYYSFDAYPDISAYERWITELTQTSKGFDYLNEAPEQYENSFVQRDEPRLDHFSEKDLENDCLTILRRCPNFENISGLSEQVPTHIDTNQLDKDDRDFPSGLEVIDEEQEGYSNSDDQPTRVWYRDQTSFNTTEPLMLTTLQQEDEIWASLFSPSDSLVESAKEVAAQLDLMMLAEDEACEQNFEQLIRDREALQASKHTEEEFSENAVVKSQKKEYETGSRVGESSINRSFDPGLNNSTQHNKIPSIQENSHGYPIIFANDTTTFTLGQPDRYSHEQTQTPSQPTIQVSIAARADLICTSGPSVVQSSLCDAQAIERSTTATTTTKTTESEFPQPIKSIEPHMFSSKTVAGCGRAVPVLLPSPFLTSTSDQSVDTTAGEQVDHQHVSTAQICEASVAQTRPWLDHQTSQADINNKHVTTDESHPSQRMIDPHTETTTRQRDFSSEKFAHTLVQPTSLDSLTNRFQISIDEKHSSTETVGETTNQQTDASHTQINLPLDQRKPTPGECMKEEEGEDHERQFKDGLSSGEQHTPTYSQNESREQRISERSTKSRASPVTSIQPLILNRSDSGTFDRTLVSPSFSAADDRFCVENQLQNASFCSEQKNRDIISTSNSVSSPIYPQNNASLVRLSVQIDRGLGLAHRTLTSPSSTSPDTSDSFLSLLDTSLDFETGSTQSLSPYRPEKHLVRINYIPPTSCCASWSYFSQNHQIQPGLSKKVVEKVITTEPVFIPPVCDTDYFLLSNQHSPLSAIRESGPVACIFRRHVLEEIQEDQVLLSTKPSSGTEQITENTGVMSSSSSSRGRYLIPRQRPRSSSYTDDYYRFGEDPLAIPADAMPEYYSQVDRRKQRSMNDVSPRNGYGTHWNESEFSVPHLTSITRQTYPSDDMASSSYIRGEKLSNRFLNELSLRYSNRFDEHPVRSDYSRPYTSHSHNADRHISVASDEREFFKETSNRQGILGVPKIHRYSTGSKLQQRLPLRRSYLRSGRPVGDDRRWQFRHQSYTLGTRESTDNSGQYLSDDPEFSEHRSQISLPLSNTAMRRIRESFNPVCRSVLGASRLENFSSLRRPASLTSSRFGSQQSRVSKVLSRSSDHLNLHRVSGFGSSDTSMQTLRAKLAAAHSESHLGQSNDYLEEEPDFARTERKYGSLDRRLQSDHITTEQLRRQVEKQHRQLLRSLMDDKTSNSMWPYDLSLHHLQNTAFSVSPYTIKPQFLPESEISPNLAEAISPETGGLISTIGAPPIFSTATSRSEFSTAYQWPTINGPLSLPNSIPSKFHPSTLSSMQTTPAVLETINNSQWQIQPQAATGDKTMPSTIVSTADRSQPSTTSLLDLLGNTELLQSVASDPALMSQLASLGVDLSIPQANQVTLAAVAGAVAATAIAQSGVFESSNFNDLQGALPDFNAANYLEQTAVDWNDSYLVDKKISSPNDYINFIPPCTVSSNDSQNLESLLQQLQTALSTGTETEQTFPFLEQTKQIPMIKQQPLDTLQLPRLNETRVENRNLDAPSSRCIYSEYQNQAPGPSEAIDGWLMPNYGQNEHETLVNGAIPNGGLRSSTDWPTFATSHRTQGSVKSDNRMTYDFPTKRVLIMRDTKDRSLPDNGIGMRIVGGHIRSDGKLGAFVEEIYPRGPADQLHGEIREGDEILEWNSIPLVGRTFEEVQSIINQVSEETELLVRARTEGLNEQDNDPPWEIHHTPGDSRNNCTPKRVDALCHHHAAQQALMNMKSRSMCPHMQRHYLSMSPSDIRQSPLTIQSTCRGQCSPIGSDSASSNAQKSSTGQTLWMEGHEEARRDLSPSQSRTNQYSLHSSRRSEPQNLEESDGDELRQLDCPNRSPAPNKRERTGSFKHRSSKSDDLIEEFGEIELILTFDDFDQSLTVHVSRAKDLPSMDLNGLADPFVKVRLHPDPTEDPDFNRQTKYMPNTLTPEWQQTVVFMNCFKRSLKRRVLEVTVWDFDRLKTNDFMGQTLINLGDKTLLDGRPHWYKLHKMQPVVIPSARKTPPSSKPNSTSADSSKQSKANRELTDKKNALNKTPGKESTASHRLNM